MEDRLSEVVALTRNYEAASFEIAYSQTGCVSIDEVADLPTTVHENGSLILAIENLAIVDEKSGCGAVTDWLGLKLHKFIQSDLVSRK